jgi:hypothetical protein
LTGVLRDRGLLREAQVVSIDREVLGEGQGFIGDVIRLVLELDRDEPGAPRTVIAKLPTTTSRKNRGFAQMNGVYEKEIRFYQDLSSRVGARTPRHYYSELDASPAAENGEAIARWIDKHVPPWLLRMLVSFFAWLSGFNVLRYLLLLEDVAPAEVGDQVSGCTQEDAQLALRTLAGIHAAFWNASELDTTWWVTGADAVARSTQYYYLQGLPPFLEAHDQALTAETRAHLEWLRAHGESLMRALAGPPVSLLHGDYRLDNLFFDRERGEIIVADWQTPLRGLPAMDVAYFISGALDVAVSSAREEELLDDYYAELLRLGVTAYDRDAFRRDYQLCMLLVLQRLVLLDSDLVDIGGARGDALMAGWLDRTARRLSGVDLDEVGSRAVA